MFYKSAHIHEYLLLLLIAIEIKMVFNKKIAKSINKYFFKYLDNIDGRHVKKTTLKGGTYVFFNLKCMSYNYRCNFMFPNIVEEFTKC